MTWCCKTYIITAVIIPEVWKRCDYFLFHDETMRLNAMPQTHHSSFTTWNRQGLKAFLTRFENQRTMRRTLKERIQLNQSESAISCCQWVVLWLWLNIMTEYWHVDVFRPGFSSNVKFWAGWKIYISVTTTSCFMVKHGDSVPWTHCSTNPPKLHNLVSRGS